MQLTSNYKYSDYEEEHIFSCRGRPFTVLVSSFLPTPPASLIDYDLVRDVFTMADWSGTTTSVPELCQTSTKRLILIVLLAISWGCSCVQQPLLPRTTPTMTMTVMRVIPRDLNPPGREGQHARVFRGRLPVMRGCLPGARMSWWHLSGMRDPSMFPLLVAVPAMLSMVVAPPLMFNLVMVTTMMFMMTSTLTMDVKHHDLFQPRRSLTKPTSMQPRPITIPLSWHLVMPTLPRLRTKRGRSFLIIVLVELRRGWSLSSPSPTTMAICFNLVTGETNVRGGNV